jgi:hydroxyacylglutathione hydrolase
MPRVTEDVYYVPGQDGFMPDAHVYVLGNRSSQDLSIIDAGFVGKGNYKIQSILKEGIDSSTIKRVIMTHTHLDHIGCLAEIRKELPGVEVWAHRLEADLLEQGDDRAVYGMKMFKTLCQVQFRLKPDAFKFKVDRKLDGGEILDLGRVTWEVIHIPGHSMGSIGLYHRPAKILIPGDVAYADHAIGRFDLYGANPSDLKKSLIRLSELEVDILLPGHNQIVKGLPKDYLAKTVRQWESCLH